MNSRPKPKRMNTPNHSLRKIVRFLNNPDEDDGFCLPNLQRPFEWSEDQICPLLGSILREYPISMLVIWSIKGSHTSGISSCGPWNRHAGWSARNYHSKAKKNSISTPPSYAMDNVPADNPAPKRAPARDCWEVRR